MLLKVTNHLQISVESDLLKFYNILKISLYTKPNGNICTCYKQSYSVTNIYLITNFQVIKKRAQFAKKYYLIILLGSWKNNLNYIILLYIYIYIYFTYNVLFKFKVH